MVFPEARKKYEAHWTSSRRQNEHGLTRRMATKNRLRPNQTGPN